MSSAISEVLFVCLTDFQSSKIRVNTLFGDLINTSIVILVFRTGILKEQNHALTLWSTLLKLSGLKVKTVAS